MPMQWLGNSVPFAFRMDSTPHLPSLFSVPDHGANPHAHPVAHKAHHGTWGRCTRCFDEGIACLNVEGGVSGVFVLQAPTGE